MAVVVGEDSGSIAARHHDLLADTMRAFAEAALDPLALTTEIARRTAASLDGYCAVKVLSEDRAWLVPAATALPPTATDEHHALLDRLTSSGVPIRVDGPHPLAQALATGEPRVMVLAREHLLARFPDDAERAIAEQLHLHGAMFVPLRLRGLTVGGMSIIRYGASPPFSEAELRFAQRIADHATPALANATLFAGAERQIAERMRIETRQRALGAFARELAEARSEPTAVVELTARRLAELVGDSCSIRLVGARRKLATAASTYDGDTTRAAAFQAAVAAFPQRPETTLSDRVAATGKSLLIPAVDATGAAPGIDAALQPLLARTGVRSILVVPLVTGGEVLAVASLGRTRGERPYTDADRQLVEEAASHAALAIGNALLLDETKTELAERTRIQQRLRVLSELAKELADATTDLPTLLELVARRITGLLGDMCFIRFVAEDGTRFTDHDIFFHPNRELVGEILAMLRAGPATIPGSFGAPVVQTNRALRLAESDPDAFCAAIAEPGRPFARRLGLRAMIGVPLVARGKVVGAIGVCRSRTAEAYTDDDMRLVEDVAAHASVAITNARLFAARLDELGKRALLAERLRVVSESSRDFASATGDSRRLMALVARRFGEIIGEACAIRFVTDDGKSLETAVSIYHADPEVAAAAEEALRSIEPRSHAGSGGEVLATGRPSIVSAPLEELVARMPPSYEPLLRALRVTSFLSAPLLSRGKVLAVLTLARSAARPPYGDDDVAFVSELATHAALAIHNSRLLESMQRELAERRRAEETLKRTEAQFRQAQKMEAVGRLAGGVAHDFNNLLTVILSSAEVLLEDIPIGDPMREDVDQIAHAGRRAADLTRQLLAFSRQQVLEPKLLDLNEVVGEMQKMIPRVVGEDIAVRVQLGNTLGIVKADPGLLGQVIMNLVVNARDAMPAGGILTIETSEVHLANPRVRDQFEVPAGAYVVLAIGDTGMGMDPATLERIFEPFFTTKEQGKGTGLGLSTVLGIVEQSGGRVWVDSVPGRGTTFRIFLPRTAEQAVPAKTTGAIRPLRGGETILLVEDDDQVRAIARIILQRNGYQVLVARSGPEALQLVEVVPSFDLLLTDVVMPRMSGPELATALVAARPKLRVLYMSGYTDEAILHHRVLEPGIALLQKPFTPESLLRRVRDVLGAPAM